jgi:NADP-dependent 3-hydroxy acid dehydrogenase YdfG
VHFQRLDISDKASVEDFGKWAESELQSVNVLVNNAGQAPISFHMLTAPPFSVSPALH